MGLTQGQTPRAASPHGFHGQDDLGCNLLLNMLHAAMQGFTIASAFLNYAPCLVGALPSGVQVTAAGIEFSPTGACSLLILSVPSLALMPSRNETWPNVVP